MIYLDYNATAPLRPSVQKAWAATPWLANPSSIHLAGQQAKAALTKARAALAEAVNAEPRQLVFTSGATEAINTVLHNYAGQRVAISAIEHDAVREAAPHALVIPVTGDGVIDLAALEQLLLEQKPQLVATMLVNNETGVIQPIEDVVALADRHGARVLCDAVQALGKLPLDYAWLGVDFMTFSAHKIGGPAGVGCLVVPDDFALQPLIHGGGQEMRRRAGTENMYGIIGFAAAAADVPHDLALQSTLRQWRDVFEQMILVAAPHAYIAGRKADRVANTTALAMPGVDSNKQVISLDLDDICVSAGSACSSGKVKKSHVLSAMGLPPSLSESAIRISSGYATVAEDYARMLDCWFELYCDKFPQHAPAAVAA